MYRGPIFFPLVLVVLGFLLLFSNLGYIQFDFWQFITTWWPLLLIIGGLDILIGSLRARNVKARTLALDLGAAAQADVSINFGAGDLTIGKAAPGKIVDGTFEGEVRYDAKPDGRVWLKLEPLNWWGWNPRGYRWNVGFDRRRAAEVDARRRGGQHQRRSHRSQSHRSAREDRARAAR